MVLQSIKTGLVAPYGPKNILGNTISIGSNFATFANQVFYSTANASASPVSNNQLSNQNFVDVGFGDTPVTENDLKLADGNMDVIRAESDSYITHPLEGKKYLTVVGQSNNTKSAGETVNKTVVYRNDTENTVAVKEIGLYMLTQNLSSQASTWTTTMQFFLAFRKVLETPITFAPGDVYAITYRIALDI